MTVKDFTSDDDISDDSNATDNNDWDEDISIKCLFCLFTSLKMRELNIHVCEEHGIDFEGLIGGMDFYDRVKFVNWVRKENINATKILSFSNIEDMKILFGWEKYLIPSMEDDGLLLNIGEDESVVDDVLGGKGLDSSLSLDFNALSFEDLLYRYQDLMREFKDYKNKVSKSFGLLLNIGGDESVVDDVLGRGWKDTI
jgi:hypothetical protein